MEEALRRIEEHSAKQTQDMHTMALSMDRLATVVEGFKELALDKFARQEKDINAVAEMARANVERIGEINKTLTAVEARSDDNESRISDIELRVRTLEATDNKQKGAISASKWIWGAAIAGGGLILSLIGTLLGVLF